MRKPTKAQIAGFLFLVASVSAVTPWLLLLFYPETSWHAAKRQFEFTFSSENDERLWFVGFALLPFAWAFLSGAMFLSLSFPPNFTFQR